MQQHAPKLRRPRCLLMGFPANSQRDRPSALAPAPSVPKTLDPASGRRALTGVASLFAVGGAAVVGAAVGALTPAGLGSARVERRYG